MMMHKCSGGCVPSMIAGALVVIGGLNWGLVGIGMLMHANWNVVNLILGSWPVVEAIVYILVGLATIGVLIGCKCDKCRMACKAEAMKMDAPKGM